MPREYTNIEDLLQSLTIFQGIHIECSQDEEKEIFKTFLRLYGRRGVSYIMRTDRGYDRQTVGEYLKFFEKLSASRLSCKETMRDFQLEHIRRKKLRECTVSEHMRVNFARIRLAENRLCFLENPISDLDGLSQKVILEWMGKQAEAEVKFVTTTSSLRHALLLPGMAFYQEEGRYVQVPDEEETASSDGAVHKKIAAKSGSKTVRDSSYQVGYTMDELEEMLKDFGFFRCHRSYIVNVQKVEEIEKWTKNSYSLRLNNPQHSQVPLAKGRVAQMRKTYNW